MRVTTIKAFSLPPDMADAVEKRVHALRPRVASLSNYLQQLIVLEMQQALLGPLPPGTGPGKKSARRCS